MVNMTPNLRFRQETGEEYPNWNMIEFERVFSTVPTSSYQIPSGEVLERGKYEVVDQGKRSIAGYSNDDAKAFSGVPAIVYGDHTTEVKFREEPFVVGADGTKILVSNIESSDLKYLYYALSKKNVAQEGYKRHFPILKTVFIPLPSLPEQKKIAEFFSLLDERISKQADKVASLREYKKGLSQRIFSRELRFKDEDGEDYPEWEEKKLGEVAEKVKRKANTDVLSSLDVLTISAGKGFLNQKERFSQVIAGNSLSKYTLLLRNEFSYNRGASKEYKYGCMYFLRDKEKALVPNVYRSFRLMNSCNPEFYEQLFRTKYADRGLRTLISSGARMDGLLNIDEDEFYTIKVPFPSLPEQEKIAALLSTMDSKIAKEEEKLAALREQKRGLLQRMFV